MEPKNYSEEDTSDLKSMGFKDEQIKKLFSLTGKEIKELLPKTTKPTTRRGKEKGEYIISYITNCQLCGSKEVFTSSASCYKDWASYHSFYQTGKATCKVDNCARCRSYLRRLPQDKLIEIILRQKPYISPYKFPQIIYTEDKEFKNYPLMVVPQSIVHSMNTTYEI